MLTMTESLKRECLELLVEQNPMLDKDSIIALFDDIKKAAYEKNPEADLKEIILKHEY